MPFANRTELHGDKPEMILITRPAIFNDSKGIRAFETRVDAFGLIRLLRFSRPEVRRRNGPGISASGLKLRAGLFGACRWFRRRVLTVGFRCEHPYPILE